MFLDLLSGNPLARRLADSGLGMYARRRTAALDRADVPEVQRQTLLSLVQKAREYINRHKNEELSLADVAKAAGASVFHFCKVFHKATGLKFTDYVARMRLEDARNRLLNPNLRISEIAYDVGFQSLTQFNRTFKRVFNQSPSDFRAHLASGRKNKRS